jgi:hypothetical protein
VVGAENSGKTTCLLNAGLEPQLLAGQSRVDRISPGPTPLANIWLAQGALFIEIGGRHFGGDARNWEQLLMVLRTKSASPLWRRIKARRGTRIFAVCQHLQRGSLPAPVSRPWKPERNRPDRPERSKCSAPSPYTPGPTRCDEIRHFRTTVNLRQRIRQGVGTLPLSESKRLTPGVRQNESKRLTRASTTSSTPIEVDCPSNRTGSKPSIYEFLRSLRRYTGHRLSRHVLGRVRFIPDRSTAHLGGLGKWQSPRPRPAAEQSAYPVEHLHRPRMPPSCSAQRPPGCFN